ncbi:tigger transposable element-derived protein 4-like [Euwallacea similis]|uniref:tigger transposable element-derived protein 4-like n=1 Tax=Euwallacea similis TaxID=1736056 RepID=UPI00344B8A9D
MASKKRILSLKEKMEIINLLDKEKLSVRSAAARFNIGKTQAVNIARNKEETRIGWQSGVNVEQKRSFLKTESYDIDKMCCDWFAKARNKNIPISDQLIKTKAKEFAEKLGYRNFYASDGWLQKWRKRYNISFKSISGESADVNQEDIEKFTENVSSMLDGYRPEDIFNADESGLFFRALPNRTLIFKSEKCSDAKFSKDRLRILFCTNMTEVKEDSLVIGKAARPCALKYIAIKDLSAIWKSNKKARMTQEIMREWVMQLYTMSAKYPTEKYGFSV